MKTLQGALRALAGAAGIAIACAATPAAAQPARLLAPTGSPAREVPSLGVRSMATPIRLDRAKALRSRIGDILEISLPNATRHEYVFDMLKTHGVDSYSWVGYHRNLGPNHRAIITTGPNGSFGTIATPEGEFRIIPGRDGQDWLVDMKAEARFEPGSNLVDDMRLPPSVAKRDAAGIPSFRRAAPGVDVPYTSLAIPTRTVDVMFVYTRGLANRLGGALMTRFNFLMTQANVAYAASGSDIGVRMVNAMMVDYPDTGTSGTALDAITPGSPSFDAAMFAGVEAARTLYGADLVAMLRNGSAFGGDGIAWLGSGTPSAAFMYSVTTGCVLGCESVFIHELGHNMGNRHDRNTQKFQLGGTPTLSAGYNFGYAFCSTPGLTCDPNVPGNCTSQPECAVGNTTGGQGTNNFADIMSYFQGSTQGNLKFASPLVTCSGETGPPLPCGTADSNAAQTLTDNAVAISGVKTQVVADLAPGYVQFAETSFGALEVSGPVVFSVRRQGGTAGTLSVTYATSNGTALAGPDFVAQSGTLTWGPGDASVKTINVPVTSDGTNENGEFFNMTLTNPAGPVGAFVGFPSTAYGIIVDAWPLNNALPSAFTVAANPWTLDTTAADRYEGTHMLRSSQVYSPTFASYTNSDVTYATTFISGPVSFAYKVSSLANFGFFELLVDGVAVYSDTGETGWKSFAYPLTAGPHAITWRFKNRLPDSCSFYGGASDNCADRAWIDAVVLPVASASSALSDVNGDGKSDVVYRNNATGQVFRLFANGTSLSGGAMAYTEPNTQWRVIADGDFNGDGVSDLLWRNTATGQVYQMPFTTAGLPGAGAVVYTEPNAAWKIIHTPDLNGDGKADLLWWNSSTGQVFGVLLNGGAVIGSGMIYTEPNTAWKIVAVGDFSGSGKKNQLLYRNESSGLVYMMTVSFAAGAFTQTGQVVYSEPNTAWTIIGAADLNGDGRSDILYRNGVTGQVHGLLMNGGAVSGSGQLHVEPNSAWKVASFGDYNGDGRADLLWRNESTGQVYMMLIGPTGLTIQSQNMVYTESNTAWRVLGAYEYAQ